MGDGALIAGLVDCYNMALVELGDGALVSQGAVLCAGTHDVDDPSFPLITKPILLGQDCWVASEAFVCPGVTVGPGAVLGARAVAAKDLEPWTIYAGNPARAIRSRQKR
jgi:putative colanic acid biosynthesis acetyltransferase WcaF